MTPEFDENQHPRSPSGQFRVKPQALTDPVSADAIRRAAIALGTQPEEAPVQVVAPPPTVPLGEVQEWGRIETAITTARLNLPIMKKAARREAWHGCIIVRDRNGHHRPIHDTAWTPQSESFLPWERPEGTPVAHVDIEGNVTYFPAHNGTSKELAAAISDWEGDQSMEITDAAVRLIKPTDGWTQPSGEVDPASESAARALIDSAEPISDTLHSGHVAQHRPLKRGDFWTIPLMPTTHSPEKADGWATQSESLGPPHPVVYEFRPGAHGVRINDDEVVITGNYVVSAVYPNRVTLSFCGREATPGAEQDEP